MKINKAGLELIKSFEGCRLLAYDDLQPNKTITDISQVKGVLTIGYGHTAGVKVGQAITQEQAENMLKSDLRKYEKYVEENMPLHLTENQFSALVSFCYNCGVGNLRTLIKDRNTAQIAEAILLYNKAGGKTLAGLVRRREAERELFLKDNKEVIMGIKAFSKAKNGNENISANFKVREFACKDGSDPIFISMELVDVLQKIRSHFGKAVNINSAYRTPSHNKKEGGATYSQHLYGMAADIAVTGVSPAKVAEYAETLLPNKGGIGRYSTFTHVDVRETKSRWNG